MKQGKKQNPTLLHPTALETYPLMCGFCSMRYVFDLFAMGPYHEESPPPSALAEKWKMGRIKKEKKSGET